MTGQQRKVTLGNRSGGLLIRFIFYIFYSMPQYESEEDSSEREFIRKGTPQRGFKGVAKKWGRERGFIDNHEVTAGR